MTTFTGVVYRATTYDVPLWVSPNRRDGRWNLAGDGCTQYFCLDATAPHAEMIRGENLRTEAEVRTFRTILWQLRVDEGAIVDYSTFDKADAVGFEPAALVDDDHERCQVEAQRLKSLGAQGVLSPSAALPGSINLTVFGARAPIAWTTTVSLASSIPVQRLSEGSAPPGLVNQVRFYDQAHPLLVEYLTRR
jgi:RES domain-containing protein